MRMDSSLKPSRNDDGREMRSSSEWYWIGNYTPWWWIEHLYLSFLFNMVKNRASWDPMDSYWVS